MYGELRNFGSSFDMSEHLMSAAAGPANVVTREAFERDVNVASSMTMSDAVPRNVDSTPIQSSGPAPLGDASGAGFNAQKSAYIEPNQGGYQARPRDLGPEMPLRREAFEGAVSDASVRMSDYRRNHLRSVTRGLRALT